MVHPPNVTFRGFYGTTVAMRVAELNRELESVFVGSGKEKLDAVDCDMCITDVTSLFGPFVKFVVEEVGGGPLVLPGNFVGHVHVYVRVCVRARVCVCVCSYAALFAGA